MSDPFLGQIQVFPYTFAPEGWMLCNGQLLDISNNTALFSILDTFYGGDGKTTFALPNLSGRAPMHFGQGPGLSNYDLGQQGGSETVALLEPGMGVHTHPFVASTERADASTPVSNYLATDGAVLYTPAQDMSALAGNAVQATGGDGEHNNMQPYLTFNFCIAVQGVYPPH